MANQPVRPALPDELLARISGGRPLSGYVEYCVGSGETLADVAKRYHVTEAQLAAFNGLKQNATIYLGQMLKVPIKVRG